MHHHNLPEVELNQADHEAIDAMAEAIASLHHLDASRVRKVLERLAVVCPEPPLPPAFEPINPPHRRLSFRPGFTQALARLPASEALSLFERVDPLLLDRRSILISHLQSVMVPFHTLDELAATIEAYIRHR